MAGLLDDDLVSRCKECGKHFLHIEDGSGCATICARCVRRIVYEPWNHCFTIFRALRDDENPLVDNGFRAKAPEANFSVEDHVEFGSRGLETQFISATGSIEVAAYFAIKGFVPYKNVPRIAVLTAGQYNEEFSAREECQRPTARNFARCFDEYVYTEDEMSSETSMEQVLHLDPLLLKRFEGHLSSFSHFHAAYQGSPLSTALDLHLTTNTLMVTLDRIGGLSRYHAHLARDLLQDPECRCSVVERTSEAEIILKLTVPARRVDQLCDKVDDVCGRVRFCRSMLVR